MTLRRIFEDPTWPGREWLVTVEPSGRVELAHREGSDWHARWSVPLVQLRADDDGPTTDRCPACWGTGKQQGSCDYCDNTRIDPDNFREAVLPCPVCSTVDGKARPCVVCDGAGHRDPIPAAP